MFVAVGVVFAVGATNYSMGPACPPARRARRASTLASRSSRRTPAPATSRSVLSVILAVLGAVRRLQGADDREPEGGDPVGKFAWKPLLVISRRDRRVRLRMLEPLGMIITIPVLIIISSFAGDEFHWPASSAACVVLTVGSWAIFILGLKLTIPRLAVVRALSRTRTQRRHGPASTTSRSASASHSRCQNLLYAFFGCILGTLIGVLPGIGPVATIAMLLPSIYALDATPALIMLAGIYYGAQYGGSTTAILINVPGESSSVVTAIDGYQMARQGRAGAALAAAGLGSFFAGCVGTIVIAAFAPPLTELAFKFGPAEYFSLMVLGLIGAVVLAVGLADQGDRDDHPRPAARRRSTPTSSRAPRATASTSRS